MPGPWDRYQSAAPTPFQAPPSPMQVSNERRAEEAAARADRSEARAERADARAADNAARQAQAAAQGSESERTAGFLAGRVVDAIGRLSAAGKADPSSLRPTLGVEMTRGVLGDRVANYFTDSERQQTRAAQIDIIDAALTLGTGAAYTKEQLEGYREAYFPQLGDSEETVLSKQNALRSLIVNAQTKAGRAAPDIGKALAALDAMANPSPTPERNRDYALPPAGGAREFRLGGGDDPTPPGLNAEQQAAYDTFFAANPNATAAQLQAFGQAIGANIDNADEIIAYRQRYGRVAPGAAAELAPPDISDARNANSGGFLENLDAEARGIADTVTLGLADKAQALGETVFSGGTYNENLRRQRAITAYDRENNFIPSLAGQIAGGFALPGSGATGARQLAALGGGYGAAYNFNTTDGTLGERLVSAGSGAAIGIGVGGALGGIQSRLARGGGDNNPRGNATALMEAANRQGIDVLPADVGGVGTRLASGMTSRTLGGIPMARAAEQSVESARAARDRIASTIGAVTDEAGGGQAAQRGARAFLDRSSARSTELHQQVPIAGETVAQTGATRQALQERTAGMQSNTMLSQMFRDPRLEGYLAALEGRATEVPTGILDAEGRALTRTIEEGGQLSWDDLRRFRSLVGEMIEQPSVTSENTSTKALRRLYAGLSQDMEATAASQGERALTLARRAIQYDRGRHARREQIMDDILGPNFDQGPQAAFEQINRWAQTRGGDFRKVGQALRSMPEDEANTIRASLLGRMGRASAGRQDETGQRFTPAGFATEWAQLSPRAKSFLFPDAAHRASIEDLVRVTNGMKRAEQFSNFSNTTAGINGAALLTGMFMNPLLTGGAAAAQFSAGKLLASRRVAQFLARPPQDPGRAIRRLSQIAAREPALAPDINILKTVIDNGSRAAATEDTQNPR